MSPGRQRSCTPYDFCIGMLSTVNLVPCSVYCAAPVHRICTVLTMWWRCHTGWHARSKSIEALSAETMALAAETKAEVKVLGEKVVDKPLLKEFESKVYVLVALVGLTSMAMAMVINTIIAKVAGK